MDPRRALFRQMQRYAFAHPLTQARGATLPYFRQLDKSISIGLTLNK